MSGKDEQIVMTRSQYDALIKEASIKAAEIAASTAISEAKVYTETKTEARKHRLSEVVGRLSAPKNVATGKGSNFYLLNKLPDACYVEIGASWYSGNTKDGIRTLKFSGYKAYAAYPDDRSYKTITLWRHISDGSAYVVFHRHNPDRTGPSPKRIAYYDDIEGKAVPKQLQILGKAAIASWNARNKSKTERAEAIERAKQERYQENTEANIAEFL